MKQAIREIIETGKWIMEKNLSWGTSGNISVKDEDGVYITASGTVLCDLQEEDITLVDSEGNVISGKKPSKETEMHLRVYRKRPDIKAVLHASPFYATALSCSQQPVKTNLFIEAMYYDENLQQIDYYHAGSAELAKAVEAVCGRSNVILMSHHGILVYDEKLSECRQALDITENVCKMNVLAFCGLPVRELEHDTVSDFLSGGYYKKARKFSCD